jgi:Protein of unknown function (DUF2726)
MQMDTLNTLLSDPAVLTALLVAGVALVASGLAGGKAAFPPRQYANRPVPTTARRAPRPRWASDPSFAADQLRAVMLSDYSAKAVVSPSEMKVLRAAEDAVAELRLPWRVMAQVSLGEVLLSPNEEGFHAINAKRVDLLLIDEHAQPIAAIEYQGEGHYQGTAPARDAIKKEALRKAGIGYLEITFQHGPNDVRREIARLAALRLGSIDAKSEFKRLVGNSPVQERAAQAA